MNLQDQAVTKKGETYYTARLKRKMPKFGKVSPKLNKLIIKIHEEDEAKKQKEGE